MEKALKIFVAVLLGLFLLAVAASAEEGAWFDMEHCDFCKNLMENPNLLPNTIWEHHSISNGLISVTTVKPEFMEAFLTANKKMEEVAKKLEKGEPVQMCNFCKSYGDLMMAGVKAEYVITKTGSVVLMTSADPTVVEKVHAFGQKINDEMAKMEKECAKEVPENK